jgi:hypothetical protein
MYPTANIPKQKSIALLDSNYSPIFFSSPLKLPTLPNLPTLDLP